MSRIGKTPINIPDSVSVTIKKKTVVVKGDKGELVRDIPAQISVAVKNNQLTVTRKKDDKLTRSLHGLTRSLIANMVIGVETGYSKKLELVGTGYRVAREGNKLVLKLGFSHPVEVNESKGITFDIEGNTKITVSGIDKQRVGQTAAEIRAISKPEPYKGKGIRYQDEIVRRKPGKAAKVGAAGGGE